MVAFVRSATLHGVEGRLVTVEVHAASGLPGFTVVGLPDAAVREARDRVRAAIVSSSLRWPQQRITVNLAPSALRKAGAGLDLAIATGVLVASGQLGAAAVEDTGFLGELGLDGSLRGVPGIVPLVAVLGTKVVVVPASSGPEASLVRGPRVCVASSLVEMLAALEGRSEWPSIRRTRPGRSVSRDPVPDLAEVRGQRIGRRALEVAAAGGHHLLMVGPPGSGKTMLARRLPGLLPDLDRDDAFEVARIASSAGVSLGDSPLPRRPPFRAPHHGTTDVALVGGGSSSLRPGEVSLAHAGVLFLDELAEFSTRVLDMLRQPLEDGQVVVTRARGSAQMPARFLLVGAMNPCPCGEGILPGRCHCPEHVRARHGRRVSGPLLDRFDLAIPLDRPAPSELLTSGTGERSEEVARRVAAVRRMASSRRVRCNAEIPPEAADRLIPLSAEATSLLERRLRSGRLSARGLLRVRRVARTVADLAAACITEVTDGAPGRPVGAQDVAEALQLRSAAELLISSDRR